MKVEINVSKFNPGIAALVGTDRSVTIDTAVDESAKHPPITVGELREVMKDLPDDALVLVDYDTLSLAGGKVPLGIWGAYSGASKHDTTGALVVVR